MFYLAFVCLSVFLQCVQKKETKMFFVISSIKLGRFSVYQISSESPQFCTRYYKKSFGLFFSWTRCIYTCICLSFYLWATSSRNYWTDLHDNYTRSVPVDKKELIINFRIHPHLDLDTEILERILQHCEIFPQFGSYLWKNWPDLHENFIVDVSLDKEGPLNFGSYPCPDSRSGQDSPGWGLRSTSALVFYLLTYIHCLLFGSHH